MSSPTRGSDCFRGSLTPVTIIVYLSFFALWRQVIFGPDSFVILRLLFLAGVAVTLVAEKHGSEIPSYFLGRILPNLTGFEIIMTLVYFASGRLAMRALQPGWTRVFDHLWSDVIVAPINEEIVFRGLFTTILLRSLSRRPALAIAIGALVFVTTHNITIKGGTLDVRTLISLLLLGSLLGWTYWKSRSVPFCMLCHSLWNLIGYIPFG
jgi:membrane protease YdiL (CAAX protease family)